MLEIAPSVLRPSRHCDVVQLIPRGSRSSAGAGALVAALTMLVAVGMRADLAESESAPLPAIAAHAEPGFEFIYFPAQFTLDQSEPGEHIQAF